MYPPLFLTPIEYELQGRIILHIYVPVGTQVSRCSGRIYDRNNESDIDITDNEELVYKLYAKKQGTYFVNKVFREIGLADELGSGMRNTYKFTKLYSDGVPQIIEGNVFKTVIPLNETATMKSGPTSSDEVSDQVENEAVEEKILEVCKTARTKKKMSEYIGYKNLTYMTRTFLKPLLESNKLAYTIPEKPQSRLQKYVTKQ